MPISQTQFEETQLTPQVIEELKKVGVREGDPVGNLGLILSPSGSLVSGGKSVISPDIGQKKLDEIQEDINKPSVSPLPQSEIEKQPPPTAEDQLLQRELDATKTTEEKMADDIRARAIEAETNLKNILDPIKNRLEQQKQLQIDSIKSEYSNMIRRQEEANTRRVRLQETIGVRFGGRFALEHTADLVQEQVDLGIQKVQELVQQEDISISKIKSAFNDKTLTLAMDEYDKLQEIRKNRDNAIDNIQKTLLEKKKLDLELKKLELSNIENGSKIIQSIGYLALNSLTGDEEQDAEILKSLSSQYKVDPGKLLSEVMRLQSEKIKYPSGIIGEYQFYVDQASAAGVPSENILDFNSYQTVDANRKARIAAGAFTPYQQFQMDQKKVTTFNQIVDKFQKSPLMVAADRASATANVINILEKNPSERENQLIAIYQFIQILDNYQSAVREGEIGLLTGTSSLREKVETVITKLGKNLAVNKDVVLDISKGMRTLVNSINSAAKNKEAQFAAQANTAGVGDLWQDYRGQFQVSYDELSEDKEKPQRLEKDGIIYELQPNGKYIKIE